MTAPHFESAGPTPVNPGETLRAAREGKSLSLQSVAQQLNLSERSLARIEAGDFSQLPGDTFARGYVRAYAKLLELDQNRLVQEFDRHTGTSAAGSNVNSLGHIDEPVRLSRAMVRFFLFALVLLVVGGAYYWWQDQQRGSGAAPAVTALERIEVEAADGTTEIHLLDRADDAADQAETDAEATEALPADEAQLTLSAGGETATESPPSAEPGPEAQAPMEQGATPAAADPAATEQASAVAAAPGDGVLQLSYTADCWTQVKDADGRVLLSLLAKAGTSRTVSGKAPLDVRLGYAPGVELSYNGEAVSLAGQIRGETARLKLGQ